MANSKRKCKQCKEYYPAEEGTKHPAGWFHNFECAIKFSQEKTKKAATKILRNKEKEKKREHRKRKESIKSRGDYLKQAQKAFNAFIRARDQHMECISCGRFHQGQYHAGHYRTVGGHPELRFSEENCHKQCAPCNNHLSGNIVEYRINLLRRFGIEFVAWLEGPHEAKKYTIDEIKEIEKSYKQKLKDLNNEN